MEDLEGIECRVCRGGEEDDRPLVAPCLCSGSILLCHQDCLEEWLAHAKRKTCELCHVEYKFQAVYADDMPLELPIPTLFKSTLRKLVIEFIPFIVRITMVILLWLVSLPLITAWLYRLWIHREEGDTMFSVIVSRVNKNAVQDDIVNGVIIAGIIALSFLVLMSFTDFLVPPQDRDGPPFLRRARNRRRGQQLAQAQAQAARVDLNNNDNNNNNNNDQPQEQLPVVLGNEEQEQQPILQQNVVGEQQPGNFNGDEAVAAGGGERVMPDVNEPIGQAGRDLGINLADLDDDFFLPEDDNNIDNGEIQIALDELLGVRGPLSLLVRNIMWLLAFNGAYIGLLAFIPISIGSTIYTLLVPHAKQMLHQCQEYLMKFDPQIAGTLTDLQKLLHPSDSIIQLRHVIQIILGFGTIALIVLILSEVVYRLQKFLPLHITTLGYIVEALSFSRQILKSGFLLFIRIFCVPILLGFAVVYSLNLITEYSKDEVLNLFLENIVGGFSLAWVLGICFMLFVMLYILQIREVFHPRFLAAWIKPQEAQKDLLASLINDPILLHIRRVVVSVGVYIVLLFSCVVVPVFTLLGYSYLLIDGDKELYSSTFKVRVWYGNPKLQMPLELFVAHICLLTFTERYKDIIGKTQHLWFSFMCRHLGLTRFLLPVMHLSQNNNGNTGNTNYSATTEATNVPQTLNETTNNEGSNETSSTTASKSIIIEYQSEGYSEDILFDKNLSSWSPEQYRFTDSIERPPEGWESQRNSARWAYGEEAKSHVEVSLAPRFVPSFWLLRLLLLMGISWIVLTHVILLFTIGPIVIGRIITQTLRFPVQYQHDPLCYVLGVKIMWKIGEFFVRLKSENVTKAYNALKKVSLYLILKVITWSTIAPLSIGISCRLIVDVLSFWLPFAPLFPVLGDILNGNQSIVSPSDSTCDYNSTCDNMQTYFSSEFELFNLNSFLLNDWYLGVALLVLLLIVPALDAAKLMFRLLRIVPEVLPDGAHRGANADGNGADGTQGGQDSNTTTNEEVDEALVLLNEIDSFLNNWIYNHGFSFIYQMVFQVGGVLIAYFYEHISGNERVIILFKGKEWINLDCIRMGSHCGCICACILNTYLIFQVQIDSCMKALVDKIRDDNYLIGTKLQSSPQGSLRLQEIKNKQAAACATSESLMSEAGVD